MSSYYLKRGIFHDQPRLLSYLGSQEKGQIKDFRTPFWNSVARSDIMRQWSRIYNAWWKACDKSIFTSLNEFEQDMKDKVGPLSIRLPLRDRMNSINEYWENPSLRVSNIPEDGIYATHSEFKLHSALRMRTPRNTVADMILSTNSGLPFFRRRKDVVQKSIQKAEWLLHNGKGSGDKAILGWRGQEGGPKDTKQRTVFMFPFHVNIAELQVYQVAIEYVQNHKLVPAYISDEAVDTAVTNLFDTKSAEDLVIATDFHRMDQHFGFGMQDTAKYLLAGMFACTSEMVNWFRNVFPIKYNIDLICSNKLYFSGSHGMGSGSGGTNFDETLTHRAMQHQAAIDHGKKLNLFSQCLGDDGMITYPGIQVKDVVDTYTKYGAIMNSDKQSAATDNVIYLRRWHHAKYRINNTSVGVYSTYRALGRLMGHERYMNPKTWSKEDVIIRALSILENVKWHPLFNKFIDFVIKGDKYRLGLDIPNFLTNNSLKKAWSEYKAKYPGSADWRDRLQSERRGIETWEVVKYLQSKQ